MKGKTEHLGNNKQSNKPQAKSNKQREAAAMLTLGWEIGANWIIIWTHFTNQPQLLRLPVGYRTEKAGNLIQASFS